MTGRILVLGAEGMLGHKMFQVLGQRFTDVIGTIRYGIDHDTVGRVGLFRGGRVIEHLDVLEPQHLQAALREMRPAAVVNCVGIIKQRPAAVDALASIAINALLPHQLAALLAEWGGRVVHFSTDCVFTGRRGRYTEEDQSDAEDLYGRTKFLGEVQCGNALTLRTSIIGRELSEHRSLLDWFLRQDGGRVGGYTRVLYSGVTTNYLAAVVADLLERFPQLSGLFQVTGQAITKHDLLALLREAFRLNVEIVRDDSVVCDRSMVGDKFRRATGLATPSWPVLVDELASDPTPYQDWMTDEAV